MSITEVWLIYTNYTNILIMISIVKINTNVMFSVQKGDRVFTLRTDTGGYAEYAVTDSQFTVHLDDKLGLEQGAAIGVPYYTAYRAVVIQ